MKTSQSADASAALAHRTHLRELDESCDICREFIVGTIDEDTWKERTGLAIDRRSRWRKFWDKFSLNMQCFDTIIPGYGGIGVTYVYAGCDHRASKHTRSGCKLCGCTRGFDSPMAGGCSC